MGGEIYSHLEESIRPLIDLIDNLRSIGIHKNISLPTIVVIGDQSSGKSSVVEALSGVALPRGTGIVTRCPLELKLKKVTDEEWMANLSYRQKITEMVNSSVGFFGARPEPRVSYKLKTLTFNDPLLVEGYVKEAQNEVAGNEAEISDQLITLEIRSSDVWDLTLIDLPGIVRVPVKGQPKDIGNQIKTLIKKFIEKPETINMVVLPCNIDIATNEALKMAQEVDPEGTRTVAVLTKPDLIDVGTEKNILAIAQNKVIQLRKGYIMVKCRGQQQIDRKIPLEEALQMEKDFFKKHKHFRCLLAQNKATIPCLASDLTDYLVNHIKKALPQLDAQIKQQSSEVRKDLKEIEGGPPQDHQGAKEYLIKTLLSFNDKIKSLSLGELILKENLYTQLRKEYEKWNDHLNSTMSFLLHYAIEEPEQKVLGGDKRFFNLLKVNHPTAKVKEQIVQNRGRELAGFSSYRVFEMLLQEHVAQLKKPAIVLLNTIKDIILKQFFRLSDEFFRRYPVLLDITMNKINQIQSSQQSKVEERIMEQFEMEKMISTQDTIYYKTLNENANETFSEAQLPVCDIASRYTDMLKAYYKIMVQRMADQVPMLTRYFMLKEAAELLCKDMLTLLDRVDVCEILSEDTDIGRKRRDLQAHLDRLNTAQEEIGKFI